jgi:hypothetical protein
MTPDGRVIEFFTSDLGSFTVLLTAPTGLSCVIAVGSDWEHEGHGQRVTRPAPGVTH